MKPFYLLTLAAALAFAGCGKDKEENLPPPSEETDSNLTIEQTDYTLGAIEERTVTVSFTALGEWELFRVEYDDAETDDEWLTVTPTSGPAGERTVQLIARINFGDTDRTAHVKIACVDRIGWITVTQTGGISDETNFTEMFDPDFAQKLQELEHISNAGNITLDDMKKIAAVTVLDIKRTSLTSLQGIEYFESLTQLVSFYGKLTSLDVSKNTKLEYLSCYSNSLTSLNVSGCTKLEELYCQDNNQLTSLDVSQNTTLNTLNCSGNKLAKLDISQNTALATLDCSNNQLTKLDISQNTALAKLYCSSNQLTELDASKNTALTNLRCYSNQLTELDASKNTALTDLWCDSNPLTSLNVSGCTRLAYLRCYSNQLTELDISSCTALEELWCKDNPGDGESIFPVTVWNDFDPDNIPFYLSEKAWEYGDKTITIQYEYKTAE